MPLDSYANGLKQIEASVSAARAAVQHLQTIPVYEFDLKHIHDAYAAAADCYVTRIIEDGVQEEFQSWMLHRALQIFVPCEGLGTDLDDISMNIKRGLLLSSLSYNQVIYGMWWARKALPHHYPTPPAGQLQPPAPTLFETRSALARYRTKIRKTKPDLLGEVDHAIMMYNECIAAGAIVVPDEDAAEIGNDEHVWATDDEEGEDDGDNLGMNG